ncbi:MAG: hypothetical protein J6T72_02765 [Alphaproteobacteria bacterium]|nr:hypothetical protein [Alphaproteobacteria bacterium]
MKKGIITIIVCAMFVFNANVAKAQIPTVDFGNIAGTIGIVTQGITNVQQGIDSIKNASKFLAIVGDSVGTITKFADKIKGYVADAQAAIEKAKQRISEGMELYNKYKGEIEDRKAKYQALLASIPNYTNPNSYNDGSSSSGSSSNGSSSSQSPSVGGSSYTGGSSYSGNQSSPAVNSGSSQNYGGSANSNSSAAKVVAPAASGARSISVGSSKAQNQVSTAVTGRVSSPATVATQSSGFRTTPQSPIVTPANSKAAVQNDSTSKTVSAPAAKENMQPAGKELPATNKDVNSLFDEEDEADDDITSEENEEKEEVDETKNISRKAFSSPTTDLATTKSSQTSAKDAVSVPDASKSAATTVTKTPAAATTEASSKALDSSKSVEATSSKVSAPTAVSTPSTSGFRQSPTNVEKRSQTLHYTSHLDFAAETNNSTKGSGYDKNGIFIFDVKYCDKSVDDLLTEKGTRDCLVKIVNKINDDNTHFAIENKADCQKMVFDTAVALLAEAVNMLDEASNYQDTLDEQGELGGNSNNTRDDTQVLAMSYEQTQLLLNRLTIILSGETILNVTKDICGSSKNVLEENEVETSSGGK